MIISVEWQGHLISVIPAKAGNPVLVLHPTVKIAVASIIVPS